MKSGYNPQAALQESQERAERQAEQKLSEDQQDEDFKWLLTTAQGRRIAWFLMSEAGVFSQTFNQNAMQMAFNEGHRRYGTKVYERVMRLNPEALARMQQESRGRNDRNNDGSGSQSKR